MKYAIGALAAILAATQAGADTLSVSNLVPAAAHLAGKVNSDPCPEPATWAMMIVGFTLLAVATRLRRKATI